MAKLPCPAELWPEFSALLDEALELPDGERGSWLAKLGAEHAAVRPWLVKVLATSPGSFDTPFTQSLVISDSAASEFVPNQQVGQYRLHRRLGSGGMGEVWLASRSDGTLNREVALKLPHIHLLAGALRRRFERERDILAGLTHPNIAQLYDAGVADGQHPFLAMECVDGVSINDHCRAANLSLEHRLDLFLQVLDAVGYAHARLIAHRDLKPSNILVTRDGRVKLLDFGIAKLLGGDGDSRDGETQLTRVGSYMATPGYAAPEQAAGEPITVAVDLYALGIVLHELLTGQRPFRTSRKTGMLGSDAGRASSRIETDYAPTVGGMQAKQLRSALCGDLDAIIAKALEPDALRRYRSAEAFALDIQRSRKHRPISARRIGPSTLAFKFIQRHRVGAAMSIGLLLVLVGGSVGIAWQAVRAEREAQRATLIKDFLIGVFRASDPRIAADKPRGEITARDLLDASTNQMETGFSQQPATQIELLGVTADIYRELDETKRSMALYARETELARRYLSPGDIHAIDGLLGQAYNANVDGDGAAALPLLAEADPLIHAARLDHAPIRAQWLLTRGEALYNAAAPADEIQSTFEAAAALFKAVAPRDPSYPVVLIDLGSLSLDRVRIAAAADFYRQAIAVAETNDQTQGNLLVAYSGLALALEGLADFRGAAAAFEHGAAVAARTYGLSSHHYWVVASDWAKFRYEYGERQAAFDSFDALLKVTPVNQAEFRNATDAMEAAQVLRKYGYCLAVDGQGARAVQLLEQARSILKKSVGHSTDAAAFQLDLAKAYEAGGRMADAHAALEEAARLEEVQKASNWKLAKVHERLGQFYSSHGDVTAAGSEFELALQLSAGRITSAAVSARAGLAAIAVVHGDSRAALESSRVALDQLTRIEDRYDIRIQPYVWGIRAQALLLSGQIAAARELARQAHEAVERYYATDSPAVTQAEKLERVASAGSARR